jgi:hypothetical protein
MGFEFERIRGGCSRLQRAGRSGYLEGGGDLEEVMRWGSRTYWVDVRVFWAGRRGLGDLLESPIWIWMRCGFRRCWGDWKAIVSRLRL